MRRGKKLSPDPFLSCREAGNILAENGRRLLLVEAMLVCLISVGLYVTLYSVTDTLQTAMALTGWEMIFLQAVYTVAFCAVTLFVTLPLLLGLLHLAGEMERGNTPTLSELFFPFSTKERYLRALNLSFGSFWRVGLVVLAVALTCNVTLYFFAGSIPAGLVCGLAVLLEIAVGFFLCMRRFAVSAVAFYEELSLPQAREIAKRIAGYIPFGGVRFFLAFLPRILLGLLTFGVYLLWDVLPRMCVAYFAYCRQMNDMIIRLEEDKNHE